VLKWQYQRERYPRLDVIRDVPLFGSWTPPLFPDAHTAASWSLLTRFARTADITRALR
jgi:hypothetical protein